MDDPKDADARFERLIRGLRESDPRVISEFFDRYGPALERLAARRIETGLRRRVGPETIAQSVCRTFLRRAEGGEYEIADTDSLWGLLSAIALAKVHDKVRFHRREKRAIDREAEIDVSKSVSVSGAEPGPDDATLFADEFAHVLASLSEEQRCVIDLRLRGQTQTSIAESLRMSERTVRRLMTALEQQLRAAFADG